MASATAEGVSIALPPVNNLTDVDQLRFLAKHRDIKESEQAGAITAKATATPSTTTIPFLEKFPLELRRLIYEFALVNPFLGDIDAIHPTRTQFGATAKSNLAPALLRTCRDIHDEALPILYGKNVFVVSGLGGTQDNASWAKLIECPLSRYRHMEPLSSRSIVFIDSAPMKRVQHWKLVVSGDALGYCPQLSIRDFCQSVVDRPMASLTILAMSRSMYESWTGGAVFRPRPVVSCLLSHLEPIKLLWKVGKVHFEDPSGSETSLALQNDIKLAAESDGTAHLVFKMYPRLLHYAQAFERAERTRSLMATYRWYSPLVLAALLRACELPQDTLDPSYRSGKFLDFMVTITPHPVEAALVLAKFAGDENDYEAFKVQRKIVVDFLEPQYQRIVAATDAWTSFVKQQKTSTGSLGASSREFLLAPTTERIIMTLEATMQLERYAKAFPRDMTPEVELIILLHKKHYDKDYIRLEREKALDSVSSAVELKQWGLWDEHFHTAARDMDEQYLEIRKFRRGLFAGDTIGADPGCAIDIKAWRCDEKIDWDVDELEMGPSPQ
ncbi:hypothetical protein VTL71DRAFT_16017 [Oculimacula yallundae]|uniref:F-box domain-containing protein n=1 Tax=Oculimacula yallundae TaxID=86028 RepID=A0ABR4CDA3_9HELO